MRFGTPVQWKGNDGLYTWYRAQSPGAQHCVVPGGTSKGLPWSKTKMRAREI